MRLKAFTARVNFKLVNFLVSSLLTEVVEMGINTSIFSKVVAAGRPIEEDIK